MVIWLGDEVVHTHPERLDPRLRPDQRGLHDDRRVDARCPYPSHNVAAVHVGQHHVEKNQVVIVVPGQFERFLPGFDLVHNDAAAPQQGNQSTAGSAIAFND